MADGKCACGGGRPEETCPLCGSGETLQYWCEVCGRAVAEKRCPLCGLKTRRLRSAPTRAP